MSVQPDHFGRDNIYNLASSLVVVLDPQRTNVYTEVHGWMTYWVLVPRPSAPTALAPGPPLVPARTEQATSQSCKCPNCRMDHTPGDQPRITTGQLPTQKTQVTGAAESSAKSTNAARSNKQSKSQPLQPSENRTS